MRLKQVLVMFAGLCFAVAAHGKPAALAPIPVVPSLTPENTLLLDLSSGGRVTIQLRPDKAPLTFGTAGSQGRIQRSAARPRHHLRRPYLGRG